MPTKYEIWLTSDKGERLAMLERVESFTYTDATHGVGFFSVTLPGTFPRDFLQNNRRVQFFRKPQGGSMGLDFTGIIRMPETRGADISKIRTIQGYGPNWLLSGRIIYAAAGSAQAQQTTYADDMMKAIVRYQMGASAATARQYPAAYFSVQDDVSKGPSITKGFAYLNVLETLRDISDDSRQAGTETFFQVLALDTTRFQFVTSTAQLGRDLRGSGMVFSDQFGNLKSPVFSDDWREERNFCYGLGKGEGANRDIQTAEDTDRSGSAWYGRRETTINASNQESAGVLSAAKGKLIKSRPITAFNAEIVSTAGAQYGIHWRNGYRIDVAYDGRQFEALIRAVTVSVNENGDENITAQIEAYL